MPKNVSFSPKEMCYSRFIVYALPSMEARHV
ncbi:hypothetical protein ABIA55_000697 [Pseudomonas frederiksbergensis]